MAPSCRQSASRNVSGRLHRITEQPGRKFSAAIRASAVFLVFFGSSSHAKRAKILSEAIFRASSGRRVSTRRTPDPRTAIRSGGIQTPPLSQTMIAGSLELIIFVLNMFRNGTA